MAAVVICNTYFPNIAHLIAIAHSDATYVEQWDSYQKQTLRNRTTILGANGTLSLTIPVVFSQKNRQYYKDVKVDNTTSWQSLHLKSLQSAYRTSPFYEYYEDQLQKLFEAPVSFLFDFNLACLEVLMQLLEISSSISPTVSYKKEYSEEMDLRNLVHKKIAGSTNNTPYIQVFASKHGFVPNLSGLDLLFNEGPNAGNYLKQQSIESINL